MVLDDYSPCRVEDRTGHQRGKKYGGLKREREEEREGGREGVREGRREGGGEGGRKK